MALLAGCGSCALAQRRHIAEREAVACRDVVAHKYCTALLGLLRRNAAFTLHLPHAEERLVHALEMRVQCGGLAGLQRALSGMERGADVGSLVQAAIRAYDGLAGLPYSEIVRSVAAWRGRSRRRPS
jgi:hypothetical protein